MNISKGPSPSSNMPALIKPSRERGAHNYLPVSPAYLGLRLGRFWGVPFLKCTSLSRMPSLQARPDSLGVDGVSGALANQTVRRAACDSHPFPSGVSEGNRGDLYMDPGSDKAGPSDRGPRCLRTGKGHQNLGVPIKARGITLPL